MRKTSKLLWLLLLVSLLAFGLASCKIGGSGGSNGSGGSSDPGSSENGDSPSTVDDEVIYSPYVESFIVLGEGVSESDAAAIKGTYSKLTGKLLSVKSADSESSAHEIIIGKTNREISTKAYRNLELRRDDEEMVGFAIYSDGKSVAIAFDEAVLGENIAFTEAISCFLSDYMASSTLKLDKGDCFTDLFFPIDRQRDNDTADTEKLWELKYSQILRNVNNDEALASSILSQLKSFYEIYGKKGETVKWLANLYDPVSGGFYHSNSARNTDSYASDLGSTSQALGLIEAILIDYGGTLTDYLGEEVSDNFVSFVKKMQNTNGYFYHPQWLPQLIDNTPERRNIDLIHALNILETFGASPAYDTPNGVKGDGVAAVSELTMPLGMSSVSAVAKLVSSAEDEIYIPPYLKSADSFTDYLNNLNIKKDPSGTLKTIYSELSLYIAVDEILKEEGADYSLCTLLAEFLTKNQNPESSLWSDANIDLFGALEDLSNAIRIYNAMNLCVPNFGYITDLVVSAMSSDSQPETIEDISVLWTAFSLLSGNIKTYGYQFSVEVQSLAVETIYKSLPTILKESAKMLGKFAKADGSFAAELDISDPDAIKSYSASEVYGMPVALPFTEEGDVGSTLIAMKNIWLSVFSVLGVGEVPIFKTSDRMLFQQTLAEMGVIIKNEVKETEPERFEGLDIGQTPNVSIEGNAAASSALIEEGPEDRGNVVHIYSPSNNTARYYFEELSSTVRSPGCYSYEFNMCFLPETSSGFSTYLYLYNGLHIIGFERVGDTVRVIECTSQWSDAAITDLGARVNIGEWFNLRVEYYLGTNETLRIKIYFANENEDQKCIAVTGNYANSHAEGANPPSKDFEGIGIYCYSGKTQDLLLDDLVMESSYKAYTAEESKDLAFNIDTPDKKQTVHGFDSTEEGAVPDGFAVGGEAGSATVVIDSDNNKQLSVTEKAGEIILPLDQRGIKTNSAVIEFEFTIDPESAVGATYQISFNEYLYKERLFGAMQLVVKKDGDRKYAAICEVTTAGKATSAYSTPEFTLGVKYKLRLHLFYKEGAMIVSYGNDGDMLEIVGINANILKNAQKFYMGETTIEALTPNIKSAIYIDNLVSERIIDDYESATNPEMPRKEYVFDDSDPADRVLSGIAPADGTLSFENTEEGGAYVEIPVNERVNVPTLTVMGVDISTTELSDGAMLIKLNDKNGNTVVALALVKSGKTAAIHEYTENGIYAKPIYTVKNDSFNLIIKYSEEKQGYNLFIDGEYITSSSLIYTLESGESPIEKLQISAAAKAGFVIDNLYFEKVTSNLITTAGTVENSDNTSPTLTYEDSSFASLPNKFTIYLYSQKAAANIREGVLSKMVDGELTECVSKVIEFYSSEDTYDTFVLSRTQSVDYTNAAYFETYMMIKSEGGKMTAKFEFGAILGSSYPFMYSLDFATAAPGEAISLVANDFTLTTLGDDITEGKWFKLRMEYTDTPYDYDYDGKNDCYVRVYINDSLVGEGQTAKNPDLVASAQDMKRIRIGIGSGVQGSLFLDDTTLGQCNMSYEKPVDPDTDTLTFSPGKLGYQTSFSFGKNTSSASIIDLTDTEGAVNKVLQFYTSAESSDKMSVIVTKPAEAEENANAVMFETEIKIDPVSDTATFSLEPVNGNNNQPFRLTLKAVKNGKVTIASYNNSGEPDVNIPEEVVIGNSGEWIDLKIEYMTTEADYTGDRIYDILYKIYSGDVLVATGYQAYKANAHYNPLTLEKYVLTADSASEATVLLDNVRFWQVALTPDEAPEFNYAEDTPLGGSTKPPADGWTMLPGTVVYPTPEPDGGTDPEEPDGGTDTEEPDGGTDTEEPDGGTDTEEPDGGTDTEEPDGGTDTEEPDGGTDTEEPDGGTDTEEPDGGTDTEEPDTTPDTESGDAPLGGSDEPVKGEGWTQP